MKNLLGFLGGIAVGLAIIAGLEAWGGAPAVDAEVAIEDVPNLDSRAIVVLEFVEQNPGSGFAVRWPAVAFAVGDGTLLLTAAHCITDISEGACPTDSTDIVAISPYYGDVFGLETVAIDRRADLAILRAPWPAHPALALADEEELAAAKDMLIVSRPQAAQINSEIRTERLPLLHSIGGLPNKAIQLKGTKKVAKGWSGSPLVLADSGAVAGITTRLRIRRFRRFRFWKTTRHDALGCAVNSIRALLREHGFDSVASRQPGNLELIPEADRGFRLAMDCFTALHGHTSDKLLESSHELAALRAASVQAHLLEALAATACAREPNAPRLRLLEQANASYLKAIEADPNNAHIRAAFCNFLAVGGQDHEALQEAEAALTLDPNDRLAQINRLRLLPFTQARQEAEQILQHDDGDPYCWFYYANALLGLNEPQKALEAAQQAVDLDPNGLFYGVMAGALAALDRLDEAEENYRLMTERCSCQRCWYNYAGFLVMHRPDQLDEAQQALNVAESKADARRVSQRDMETLKFRLLEKTSPQQAEALARERLDAAADDAATWWHLASILRTQERYDEAVEAAAEAVELDPNGYYRPRLANCLAKTGDLDAARRIYDEMLDRHPERQLYWYWYAEFLADYHPDRIDEARTVLEKTANLPKADRSWSIPASDLAELQGRLDVTVGMVR